MSAFKAIKSSMIALTLTFGSANAAYDASAPRINEKINGIPTDINCTTAFKGGQPIPRLIGWVDSTRYHGGQVGPIQYMLMPKEQRQDHWKVAGIDPRNKAGYNMEAARYDYAVNVMKFDKVETLKDLFAGAHKSFPKARWDRLAARCEVLNKALSNNLG